MVPIKRTALKRKQPLRRKPAKPKPRKPKKPSRTRLRNRADKLFSLYVRRRDGACIYCGAGPENAVLQCAHILSRRYGLVRWDPANAVTLCLADHMKFTHDPLRWDQFIESRFGLIFLQDLKRRALRVDVKPDVEAAIQNLEALLAADA